MKCRGTWVLEEGERFEIQVTEVAEVVSYSGRLLVTDWEGPDTSPPPRTYTRKQLERGVRIPMESGMTYNVDVVVIPKRGKEAIVHTVIRFDGAVAMDEDCGRTADKPLCEWEVTRT